MNRLFSILVLLAVTTGIPAAGAWASVPDPVNSGWTWANLECGFTKAFICPAADSFITSAIFVSVRDQFDAPMPGVLVEASFYDDGCLWLCEPVRSFTQVDGVALLLIYGGLDVSGDTACCVVETEVKCMGVGIPYCVHVLPEPQVCTPTDTREWLSPDMTQGLGSENKVEGLDYAIFSTDWLTASCRSDYNCDGEVEGRDYSMFARHWLHLCP
ncbi:MAG: hypothetical protein AMJ46_06275 [Latescibacteria bacterium DG_63]|nr:MAG: hypothetical protein AMJ46_06275 [Latescibacteria bacterium DG_63]